MVTEDSASMEVEIDEKQVQELRDKVGDLIAGQLMQKPDQKLIAELLNG